MCCNARTRRVEFTKNCVLSLFHCFSDSKQLNYHNTLHNTYYWFVGYTSAEHTHTHTPVCRSNQGRLWIRSPDHPARSQSLYRLRYPVHMLNSRGYELCFSYNILTETNWGCFVLSSDIVWSCQRLPWRRGQFLSIQSTKKLMTVENYLNSQECIVLS